MDRYYSTKLARQYYYTFELAYISSFSGTVESN